MRTWALTVVAVAAAGTVAGCDGSDEGDVSRESEVIIAAVRDVLTEQPPPPEPDELPVVFVVGVGERDIPAVVQAEVTRELDDAAAVRFADERGEAIEEDEEHVPVRDAGVLLVLGEVAGDEDVVQLSVEVYRSDQDWSKRVLTIASGGSEWTVTSSSVLPAGDA